jgi:hypothetical protein
VSFVAASLAIGALILTARFEHRSGARVGGFEGATDRPSAAAAGASVGTPPPTAEVGPAERPTFAESRATRDGWKETEIRAVGHLYAAPNAAFHLPSESAREKESSYTVLLDSGELCAQVSHRDVATQGPFVVQAPAMRAVVVGTRFCVFAGSTLADSWVMVEEGKVRVERAGGASTLAGPGAVVHALGESASMMEEAPGEESAVVDAPTAAALRKHGAHLGAPGAPRRCAEGPPRAREECLWRQAGGAGLAAQNALYLLGVMARDQHDGAAALAIWHTYEHRFPAGALAAETEWNVFDELIVEHRYDEALAASQDFVERHGNFFRAGELQLRRAELLAEAVGRPQEAEAEYRRMLSRESRAALRDEALFGLARCLQRLNRTAEARAEFERYQSEFPRGKHRAEVGRELDE